MQSQSTNVSKSVGDFISSLGVCAHFNVIRWYDGPYRQPDKAVEAIQYLGISHVRVDSVSIVTSKPYLAQLAASDVTFTFMINAGGETSPHRHLGRVADFERENPGSVNAIEGPNEIWNWPVSYKGLTGDIAAQEWQKDTYDIVRSNTYLRDKKVYDYTDLDSVGRADYSNVHMYSTNGGQPSHLMEWHNVHAYQQIWATGRPKVLTEIGMPIESPRDTNPVWEPVNELTQARMSLNSYAAAFSYGYQETYLFELVKTEFTSINDTSQSPEDRRDFGLFNQDWTPRLSARSIANFTDALDSLQINSSFVNTFTFENQTNRPSIKTQALSLDGDSMVLLLWRENDIWDEVNHRQIDHALQDLQLSVGGFSFRANYYDPISGTGGSVSPSGKLSLGDNLLVVNIDVSGITQSNLNINVQMNFAPVPAPPNYPVSHGYAPSPIPDHLLIPNSGPGPDNIPSFNPWTSAPAASAPADSPPVVELYRFFEKRTGTHFYTPSAQERDDVRNKLSNYNYEGVAFNSVAPQAGADPVYRFFNGNTGTHFFTISVEERDNIIGRLRDYKYEGVGFYASDQAGSGLQEVYRFFNKSNGTHFYTASPEEKFNIQSTLKNFSYEGVGFYVPISNQYDLFG